MKRDGNFPCGNFFEDAGPDAMPNVADSGILQFSIRRFELWTKTASATAAFFKTGADALERLFDTRRGGGTTLLNLPGDGLIYDSDVLTGLQGPFFDDDINAWYATMAFRFVEARP
jgi:hypothetical protein